MNKEKEKTIYIYSPHQSDLFTHLLLEGSQEEIHSRAVDQEGTKLHDLKIKWNNHHSTRVSIG